MSLVGARQPRVPSFPRQGRRGSPCPEALPARTHRTTHTVTSASDHHCTCGQPRTIKALTCGNTEGDSPRETTARTKAGGLCRILPRLSTNTQSEGSLSVINLGEVG